MKPTTYSLQNTPTRVLMCPPSYYLIPNEKNATMQISVQPKRKVAWWQWTAIHNLYIKLGLDVHMMEPVKHVPEQVFTANLGWGRRRNASVSEFVFSNFRYPDRQREVQFMEKWARRFGLKTFKLPYDEENLEDPQKTVYFEGQGDVVTADEMIFFGYGPRSSYEAIDYVRNHIRTNKRFRPLELVGDKFYHVDTCTTSLRGTNIPGFVYYPGAFTPEAVSRIRELRNARLYALSENLANCFAANSVFVNDVFLLNVPFDYKEYSKEAFELSASGSFMESAKDRRYKEITGIEPDYADFIDYLWQLGYKIIPVYTSEFFKSGAGVRCLTLFLD